MAYGSRSKNARDTGVTFPLLECWSPVNDNATFAADVNGRRVLCRVEPSALQADRPVKADICMKALARHRSTMQATARKLIEEERFQADGSILIRKSDL